MQFPTGLAISCDTVLISQCDDHILVNQLDGNFVSRIGNRGSGDLQFKCPFGLTTDESNNDIHICDSLLTSLVIFLSQILILIRFSFLIQNLNSFTNSQLLTDLRE